MNSGPSEPAGGGESDPAWQAKEQSQAEQKWR